MTLITHIANFGNSTTDRKNPNSSNVENKSLKNLPEDVYIKENKQEKPKRKQLPHWAKILIVWGGVDMLVDYILDRQESKEVDRLFPTDGKPPNKFNIFRPFSWFLNKLKKL